MYFNKQESKEDLQQENLLVDIPNEYLYLFETENESLYNYESYGPFVEMVKNGHMDLYTDSINISNWEYYINSITNIFNDGIDLEKVHNMYAIVHFNDGKSCVLYATDLFFNIIFWQLTIATGEPIRSYNLFFDENITISYITNYIDNNLIFKYKYYISNIELNNIIHNSIKKLALIDNFAYYLSNTYSINDDIIMMNQDPEVYEILHLDVSKIPLEDVKDYGMKMAYKYIDKIINSDHCLRNSFRTKEGTNPKQFKEQYISIGTKPNGQGSVYPFAVNRSFLNGGVNTLPFTFIESANGINAQIISKNNVGKSGDFARILSLNNRESILNRNPDFVCASRNFQEVIVTDDKMLDELSGRYYRLHPEGIEYKVTYSNKSLIGKLIYLRSPMTCESRQRGEGVCFRCYGDLAYINCDINIGQVAAEIVSSQLTQRQLSAKHLLESKIRKLSWNDIFHSIFKIIYNSVCVSDDDLDLSGFKISINTEDIYYETESEDKSIFNENITQFTLITPDNERILIYGADNEDNRATMYINPEFKEIINKKYNINNDYEEIVFNLDKLVGMIIFNIEICNDELSKTLNSMKNLINKKETSVKYDRHELLRELIKVSRDGGLNVNPVHLEVILSNQLRDKNYILREPDWSIPDVDYDILWLDKALRDNPSVTTSLSYQKIKRAFYNPINFLKRKASSMDLIFMKQPQNFIGKK